MKRLFSRAAIAAAAMPVGTAIAHGGHGLQGAHWHATDVYGFAVVVVLAAAAIWISRDK